MYAAHQSPYHPLERDTSAVLQDVQNEYVSIEGAARDYGVVIEPETMTVDDKATDALRTSMGNGKKVLEEIDH